MDKFLRPCRDHVSFQTANGRTMASHEMDGYIPEFGMRVDPYVVGELVSRAKAALPPAHSAKRVRWKTSMEDISVLRCAQ